MLQAQIIEQAKVVIGIAAYNEESSIASVIIRMRGLADEILLCDDGSSDSTSEIAEAMNCKVLSNAHKLGPVEAMRTLFLEALKSEADVLVVAPTNAQFERGDISKLADGVLKGECEIAVGSRVQIELPKAEGELSGEVLSASGMPLRDPHSPFRAYGKQALSKLVSYLRDDNDVLTYAMKLGLSISEYQLSTLTESREKSDVRVKKSKKPKTHSGGFMPYVIVKLSSFHPTVLYAGLSIATFGAGVVAAASAAYEYLAEGIFANLNIEIALALFLIGAIFNVATVLLDSIQSPPRPPS
ncbi:MAG: glycosyltransferase [Nitrososphaerales archaeon]